MAEHTENTCETRILVALRRVIRSVDLYSRKLHAATGLTTPQLVCLHALTESECMTLSELARSVNLGVSTVNGIIDRLAVKGFVRREKSREDRRKVYVYITSTGTDTVLRAPSLLQDRLSDALSRLPVSERHTLTESLERIVWLMEAEQMDASPNLFTDAQIESMEKQTSPEEDISC